MSKNGEVSSISKINEFKMQFTEETALPVNRFIPLKSWPAHPHPRQKEIDAFRNVQSRYA